MFATPEVSLLADVAATGSAVLLDASIKGFVLLAGAALLMRLLRRSAAATRHLTLVLAVAGLVLLPLLSYSLPAWRFPIPAPMALPFVAGEPVAPRGEPQQMLEVPAASPPSAGDAVEANNNSRRQASQRVHGGNADTERLGCGWSFWIGTAWCLGAGALLMRWAVGKHIVARMIRCGRSLGEDRVVRDLQRELALHRRVGLVGSNAIRVPVTTGVFRPTVLLPLDQHWPPQRYRLAVAHELAHVKRWDCATDWLFQLGCAIHWFNPLVWLLARRARLERECACDDLVLNLGIKPTDYAEMLLDFVRLGSRGGSPHAALGMATPSLLERRLSMILAPQPNRHPLTRRAAFAGTALLLLAVVPLSAFHPTSQAAPPETPATGGSGERAQTDENQAAEVSWGPLVERVVLDDRPGWEFLIDLDTGKVAGLPEEVQKQGSLKEQFKWLREQGFDAMGESKEGLYGFAMIARAIDGPIADRFPDDLPVRLAERFLKELVEVGDPGTPMPMTARGGQLPETFLFVTSDGAKGVLQIVEFTDDPSGVKIRYKLLKERAEDGTDNGS